MAIKHLIWMGLAPTGEGTVFIPTIGFTPGEEVVPEPEPSPATTPGRRVTSVPRSARRQGTPPARYQGRTPQR